MSKEMTPKEALNELCDLATPNGDCINYVTGMSGIILKALDRLEYLEKENNTLNDLLSDTKESYVNVLKENQELKNWNEKYLNELKRWGYPKTPIHISEYEKLKKKINILTRCIPYYNFKALHSAGKITDEELEVLENE